MFSDDGKDNNISLGRGVSITGFVRGANNSISISDTDRACHLDIRITGDNNEIAIGRDSLIKGLNINIGSYTQAFKAIIRIGNNFSVESDTKFFVYNSGNKILIGEDCMFSNNIVLRTGESPHLIFEFDSGKYIDDDGYIDVGDHCWIGEQSYLTKRARIGPESIVAACSVVTRGFEEQNVVIGGNPATIVKRGIQWIRNRSSLEDGSKFKHSYLKSVESFRS